MANNEMTATWKMDRTPTWWGRRMQTKQTHTNRTCLRFNGWRQTKPSSSSSSSCPKVLTAHRFHWEEWLLECDTSVMPGWSARSPWSLRRAPYLWSGGERHCGQPYSGGGAADAGVAGRRDWLPHIAARTCGLTGRPPRFRRAGAAVDFSIGVFCCRETPQRFFFSISSTTWYGNLKQRLSFQPKRSNTYSVHIKEISLRRNAQHFAWNIFKDRE